MKSLPPSALMTPVPMSPEALSTVPKSSGGRSSSPGAQNVTGKSTTSSGTGTARAAAAHTSDTVPISSCTSIASSASPCCRSSSSLSSRARSRRKARAAASTPSEPGAASCDMSKGGPLQEGRPGNSRQAHGEPGSARTPGRPSIRPIHHRPRRLNTVMVGRRQRQLHRHLDVAMKSTKLASPAALGSARAARVAVSHGQTLGPNARSTLWAERSTLREMAPPGGGGGADSVYYDVSVDIAKRVHRIQVAEHLGVRLPASPPPRALDDEELFIIEG